MHTARTPLGPKSVNVPSVATPIAKSIVSAWNDSNPLLFPSQSSSITPAAASTSKDAATLVSARSLRQASSAVLEAKESTVHPSSTAPAIVSASPAVAAIESNRQRVFEIQIAFPTVGRVPWSDSGRTIQYAGASSAGIFMPPQFMTTADIVRELTSVYVQREAETAAAISLLTASGRAAATVNSNPTATTGQGGEILQGSLEFQTASSPSPFSGSIGSCLVGVEDSSDAEGAAASSGLADANATSRSAITSLHMPSFDTKHGASTLQVSLVTRSMPLEPAGPVDTLPSVEATASVTSSSSSSSKPAVRLVVTLPPGIQAHTRAFLVPAPTPAAPGAAMVGPPGAVDAMTAIKHMLSFSLSQEEQREQFFGAAGPETASHSVCTAPCRLFHHAILSPNQSAARVVTLVEELRDREGYHFTYPIAPLASSRFGSHASSATAGSNGGTQSGSATPRSKVVGHGDSTGNRGGGLYSARKADTQKGHTSQPTSPFLTPLKSFASAAASPSRRAVVANPLASPIVISSADFYSQSPGALPVQDPAVGLSESPTASSPRSSFHAAGIRGGGGKRVPTLTFNFSCPPSASRKSTTSKLSCSGARATTASPSSASALSALMSPSSRLAQKSLLARRGLLAASFQAAVHSNPRFEDPQALEALASLPQALARFTSRADQTRAGFSPATFDKTSHAMVLQELQRGLESMSAQRRAEEEHMRRVTRVKPSKNPRGGGYVYMNVDTGVMVSSHAYEPSYLAEVAFGCDYVANATLEAWKREASARLEEMEAWSPSRIAQEVQHVRAAKEARISWWDQDVEEGIVGFGDRSATIFGEGSSLSSLHPPSFSPSGPIISIGGFIQRSVLSSFEACKRADARTINEMNVAAATAAAAAGTSAPLTAQETFQGPTSSEIPAFSSALKAFSSAVKEGMMSPPSQSPRPPSSAVIGWVDLEEVNSDVSSAGKEEAIAEGHNVFEGQDTVASAATPRAESSNSSAAVFSAIGAATASSSAATTPFDAVATVISSSYNSIKSAADALLPSNARLALSGEERNAAEAVMWSGMVQAVSTYLRTLGADIAPPSSPFDWKKVQECISTIPLITPSPVQASTPSLARAPSAASPEAQLFVVSPRAFATAASSFQLTADGDFQGTFLPTVIAPDAAVEAGNAGSSPSQSIEEETEAIRLALASLAPSTGSYQNPFTVRSIIQDALKCLSAANEEFAIAFTAAATVSNSAAGSTPPASAAAVVGISMEMQQQQQQQQYSSSYDSEEAPKAASSAVDAADGDDTGSTQSFNSNSGSFSSADGFDVSKYLMEAVALVASIPVEEEKEEAAAAAADGGADFSAADSISIDSVMIAIVPPASEDVDEPQSSAVGDVAISESDDLSGGGFLPPALLAEASSSVPFSIIEAVSAAVERPQQDVIDTLSSQTTPAVVSDSSRLGGEASSTTNCTTAVPSFASIFGGGNKTVLPISSAPSNSIENRLKGRVSMYVARKSKNEVVKGGRSSIGGKSERTILSGKLVSSFNSVIPAAPTGGFNTAASTSEPASATLLASPAAPGKGDAVEAAAVTPLFSHQQAPAASFLDQAMATLTSVFDSSSKAPPSASQAAVDPHSTNPSSSPSSSAAMGGDATWTLFSPTQAQFNAPSITFADGFDPFSQSEQTNLEADLLATTTEWLASADVFGILQSVEDAQLDALVEAAFESKMTSRSDASASTCPDLIAFFSMQQHGGSASSPPQASLTPTPLAVSTTKGERPSPRPFPSF